MKNRKHDINKQLDRMSQEYKTLFPEGDVREINIERMEAEYQKEYDNKNRKDDDNEKV